MKNNGQNFGPLAKSANQSDIQVGSSFQTQDNTGTPQTSPLAYTTSLVTLVVPDNATQFIFTASTAINISELSTMARYYTQPINTPMTIDCSRLQNIYLQSGTGGTLNFMFKTV